MKKNEKPPHDTTNPTDKPSLSHDTSNSTNDSPLADVLLQLDNWINDCQLQADMFFEKGMLMSETSSLAMKVAYMNARSLIKQKFNVEITQE